MSKRATKTLAQAKHYRTPNWDKAYRPKSIGDLVLPPRIKSQLQGIVDRGACGCLIFAGPPGMGKTTTAKLIPEQLDMDWELFHGPEEGTIDVVRNKLRKIATLGPGMNEFMDEPRSNHKILVIDEVDYLISQNAQGALRGVMDDAVDTSFILTCNQPQRLTETLRSRCSLIDFGIRSDEKSSVVKEFVDLACSILGKEHVEFDRRTVELVTLHLYPDFRRVLVELEAHSATGILNPAVIKKIEEAGLPKLVAAIKERRLGNIRGWLALNSDMNTYSLIRAVYEACLPELDPANQATLAAILARYAHMAPSTLDQEINLTAALAEIAVKCFAPAKSDAQQRQ
jgi:DNA polymerase III delta prime subunit